MDVSDRRLQVQLTLEAKIASDFFLVRAIWAFAGFISALTGGALLPRHYHPLQISLAPLCSTSEICKEAIFALENGISRRKNQHPRPTYTPSGAIYMREGFGPLALSRVFDKLASGAIRPGLLFFSQRRICP